MRLTAAVRAASADPAVVGAVLGGNATRILKLG